MVTMMASWLLSWWRTISYVVLFDACVTPKVSHFCCESYLSQWAPIYICLYAYFLFFDVVFLMYNETLFQTHSCEPINASQYELLM